MKEKTYRVVVEPYTQDKPYPWGHSQTLYVSSTNKAGAVTKAIEMSHFSEPIAVSCEVVSL